MKWKVMLFALALLLVGRPMFSQTCQSGQSCSGNLIAQDSGACTTTGACTTLPLPNNAASVALQLSGGFSGTVQFEQTADGANWVAASGVPQPSGTAVTSATAAGMWRFVVSGATSFRVRCSTYSSGQVGVQISASAGSASGAGGGGAGTVTSVSGTTNQIGVATGTTTPVISLTSPVVFPGNISGPAGWTVSSADTGTPTATFSSNLITLSQPLTVSGAATLGAAGSAGGSFVMPEGATASGSANNDVCYADSTVHAVRCSFNGGSFFTVGLLLSPFVLPGNLSLPAGATIASADTGTPTITWAASSISLNQPLTVTGSSELDLPTERADLSCASGSAYRLWPSTGHLLKACFNAGATAYHVGLVTATDTTATDVLHATATAGTYTSSAVLDSDLSTSDITTNNVSTSKHGFTPKLDNTSTHFLNGQGGWTTPTGGTGITAAMWSMSGISAQTPTGTQFLPINGATNTLTLTEAQCQMIATVAGTVTGISARVSAAEGGAATLAFTVRKCTPSSGACTGSSQAITCTIPNSGLTCTDTTGGHAFTFAAGDFLDITTVQTGTGTSQVSNVNVSYTVP